MKYIIEIMATNIWINVFGVWFLRMSTKIQPTNWLRDFFFRFLNELSYYNTYGI